ncbi:Hpt domain-containing protein [Adhaeribacter radiodurans]|uniref:HPt domain-containing protein n=1 Tax=Adhaeribacter radiodurans TaxID=2745197 RepID=A0A7L7L824_9BACT|nr:Hpt domain-containing protein [Adhaeribacter radiodurans]QMU28970.1 hypothetical protein HUW48_13385 [Adhaeribacter radiodurans]
MAKAHRKNTISEQLFPSPNAGQDTTLKTKGNFVNLKYLQEVGCNNAEFITEMITLVLQQTPENIKTLYYHTENQDWVNLKKSVHKMRSAATLVGVEELHTLINLVETYSARQVHLELLPILTNDLVRIWHKVLIELTEILNDLKSDNT